MTDRDHQDSDVLGKYTAPAAPVQGEEVRDGLIAATEEIMACYQRIDELETALAEWKQAASVEAGLRREFLARAESAEERIDELEKALKRERDYWAEEVRDCAADLQEGAPFTNAVKERIAVCSERAERINKVIGLEPFPAESGA